MIQRDIQLGEEQSQKAKSVLRLRLGDKLRIFDGRGREFLCEVVGLPGGRRTKQQESNAVRLKQDKVGGAEKKVVPKEGGDGFTTTSVMAVTLSSDHRVVDGAIGAEFLKSFKKHIESPLLLLL